MQEERLIIPVLAGILVFFLVYSLQILDISITLANRNASLNPVLSACFAASFVISLYLGLGDSSLFSGRLLKNA